MKIQFNQYLITKYVNKLVCLFTYKEIYKYKEKYNKYKYINII
jgi:hypothetical protein